ncbi:MULTISPECIES: hypothetical protein [Myxococcus]|uniref:hypothetical protein n=1 Tax=Myxococcus TaxID=32 RepID=UPI0013D64D97|nr:MULTISPECIES: hypothetical protein [Myxococcus]NVJ25614.1 hypothetical protein [Myxococcus sp. AM011]
MTHRLLMASLWWGALGGILTGAAPASGVEVERPTPVELRWKVPVAAPLRYTLTATSLPGREALTQLDSTRPGLWGLSPRTREPRPELVLLPREVVMTAELARVDAEDLAARVTLTRVEVSSPEGASSKDARRAKALVPPVAGTVLAHSSLMDLGIITRHLPQEQHNLVALLFELPARPVAVGDTWALSMDLIGEMGFEWHGERERFDQARLTALERDAAGRTVAIIDFTLTIRDAGYYEPLLSRRRFPASDTASYVGRGEFLVEEGRWKRLSGEISIQAKGVVRMDSAYRFVLEPLEPARFLPLAAE